MMLRLNISLLHLLHSSSDGSCVSSQLFIATQRNKITGKTSCACVFPDALILEIIGVAGH